MAELLESSAPDFNPDWWVGSYSTFKKEGTKEEDYCLRSSNSNRHTYLVDENGKKRVISRAAFKERLDAQSDSSEVSAPQEDSTVEHSRPRNFDGINIRSLAREAWQAREDGDQETLLNIEDELQERIIEHAERGGWDNKTTDAALQYIIDIAYNNGAMPPDLTTLGGEPGVGGNITAEPAALEVDPENTPEVNDIEKAGGHDPMPFSFIFHPPVTGASPDYDEPEGESRLAGASSAPVPSPTSIAPISPALSAGTGEKKAGIRNNKFIRRAMKIGGAALVAVAVFLAHDRDAMDSTLRKDAPAPAGTPATATVEADVTTTVTSYIVVEESPTNTPEQGEVVPTGTATPDGESTATAVASTTLTATSEATVTSISTPTPESSAGGMVASKDGEEEETGASEEGTSASVASPTADTNSGIGTSENSGEIITLRPDDETGTPGDNSIETEREGISVEVRPEEGITHVLQRYMTDNVGIAITDEQSYDLYAYLVANYDITKVFGGISFYEMPNGDIGIQNPGTALVTPLGQDAIVAWLEIMTSPTDGEQ